jgi:hypothetical protein
MLSPYPSFVRLHLKFHHRLSRYPCWAIVGHGLPGMHMCYSPVQCVLMGSLTLFTSSFRSDAFFTFCKDLQRIKLGTGELQSMFLPMVYRKHCNNDCSHSNHFNVTKLKKGTSNGNTFDSCPTMDHFPVL